MSWLQLLHGFVGFQLLFQMSADDGVEQALRVFHDFPLDFPARDPGGRRREKSLQQFKSVGPNDFLPAGAAPAAHQEPFPRQIADRSLGQGLPALPTPRDIG